MVWLPPPQLASASRPSYGEAYAKILATHRRAPLTSASSVIILAAPDVDALCASKMLADLFKQDDVMHRLIPVSGHAELERVREELTKYRDLHTLIMFNMGAIIDLPSEDWFGDFPTSLTVHVIDSSRPQNLASVFGTGENGDRIIIWDDGGVEDLQEERKAWEVLTYAPEEDSDEEDSDQDSDEAAEEDEEDDEEGYEGDDASPSRKRRSLGEGGRKEGKRRKLEQPNRISREERAQHESRLMKYYRSGTWHGQSASGTMYILATVLERVDNDLLWLAILGLTYQYITSRISRDDYDKYQRIYHDEVARLNPAPPAGFGDEYKSQNPDDNSVYASDELRFMMFRHWNLYDAMYHSSYVATKLGIWKERGRKRLTGLLAKMGFSITDTQQPYPHMAKDLKLSLRQKLDQLAPDYGLVELSYPSFARCYGYRSQPLSAGDAVEALSALLDIAGGTRIEVEVEGTRNGGEWFGGGKIWDGGREGRYREDERENVPPGMLANVNAQVGADGKDTGEKVEVQWWMKNFWSAYDALSDIERQRDAISLSMSMHRAIMRQGASIIDKQDIKTLRGHRVVVLTQGPDLPLFVHPGILARLALWLLDALRDRVEPTAPAYARSRHRKALPLVVACLNEKTGTFIVVGVTGAPDFDNVRKNEFGLAFLDAKERCNARTRHGTFDTSVLEINKEDLKVFLETLCEGGERF
ncbi:CDC45-like protein [Lenzites betulinus]|nr:CDC45-like protein [Lenzites betulinus]